MAQDLPGSGHGSDGVPLGEEALARRLQGGHATVFRWVAIALAVFQLYTAGTGALPNIMQRAIHVGFAVVLCLAYYAVSRRRAGGARVPWFDWGLMVLTVLATIHTVTSYDRIVMNPTDSNLLDRLSAIVFVLVLMEASRRTIGWIFPILVAVSAGYIFIGHRLTGIWAHRGFGVRFLLENLYMTTNGLWGQVTGVSATVIAIFIVFGSILQTCGGGRTFIDLSLALAGRLRGGAAKVAVLASSLFGMISGSGPANVATTGTLTIPMMKRLGYSPEFAAAVESTASTGGQIAPPIMGAGAFVMAEFLNVPYWTVAKAAVFPAFLYYLGTWMSVDFSVGRSGLKPVAAADIPRLRDVLRPARFAPLFVPIIVLLVFLALGMTLDRAGFWAAFSAMALYLVVGGPVGEVAGRGRRVITALERGGKGIVTVAALATTSQIVVAVINLTGLGPKVSQAIVTTSGGVPFVTLLLAMAVSLVLGMGMPTVAAYILTTTVVGTALTQVGILPMAAHMFMFYFAVISAITPPVCSSVYVGAGIAGSNWLKTALLATRFGVAGFLVPFLFVYSPELLLQGSAGRVLVALVTATIGTTALAAGLAGFWSRSLAWWERTLLSVAGVMMVDPGLWTDLAGFAAVAAIYVWQRRTAGAARPTPQALES